MAESFSEGEIDIGVGWSWMDGKGDRQGYGTEDIKCRESRGERREIHGVG